MMIYFLMFFIPAFPIWIILELMSFFSRNAEDKISGFSSRIIIFYLWPIMLYYLYHKFRSRWIR